MSSDQVRRTREGQTPVILFNRYVPGTGASAVCCDNFEGGREVALRLAEAGHKTPAFIAGLDDASTSADRQRGFRAGCAEAGLPEPQLITGGDFTYETGYQGMQTLCAKGPRPDAVFCANDIVAIGAMDAARRELGLKVPEDVSIVGFDDIEMSAWPSHDLTTVRQPMNAMLDKVIAEVDRLLTPGGAMGQDHFLPGRLILRNSARLNGE